MKSKISIALVIALVVLCIVELLYVFKPEEYTITFDTVGGTEISEIGVIEGTTINDLIIPKKDGYTFLYWISDGKVCNKTDVINQDMHLVAVWQQDLAEEELPKNEEPPKQEEVKKYEVIFNSDGGNAIETQEISEGEKIIKPDNPKKDGYTFLYWISDGKEYNFDTKVTANITLKAKWEKIKEESIEKPETDENPPKYSYDISKLYWGNLHKQTKPRKLLVLLFNYSGNPYYTDSIDKVAKAWSDYIFGTGSIISKNASINDYLKEISKGKFYYEPTLLGDNNTGVYVVNVDNSYSYAQGNKFDFFDFQYDIAQAMDSLAKKNLNINCFKATSINNSNFRKIMMAMHDANQAFRAAQWYDTDNVMAIFPPINTEKVDFTPLSTDFNSFGLYAHINYDSSFGTIAHELIHTLGAIDIYNFGAYGSDLMSSYYPSINHDYNTMHINPYYKILFGWVETKILENSATITLYSATSDKYNPVIVKTKDSNQYYIIENRKAERFDHGIYIDSSEGINIWRVDKLGMEAIYNSERKGLSVEKLTHEGEMINLKYYEDFININNTSEISSGVTIQYIKKNADGSINVKIEQ